MKLLPLGELHTYIYFNHYYFCLLIVEDGKILELNDTIMMKLSGHMSLEIRQVPSILTFNDLINGKFVTFLLYNIY